MFWNDLPNDPFYVRAVCSLTPSQTSTATRSQTISLRSAPLVSEEDTQKMLGLDDNWRPFEYLENDIKEVGEVLVDSATGLMWQKSGPISVSYQGAQAYVEELNRGRFADYDDWRLPTIAELLSLLEPEKQAHELYINPMVESKQYDRRWSSDNISADSAWFVDFYFGFVDWPDDFALVRAVRSL